MSRIPGLDHPVKREGPPNDAAFTIGNGSFTYTGQQLPAAHFLLSALGVEKTLEDGRIERIVVAPNQAAYAIERTNEPIVFHGVDDADVESWVRAHAAAAKRRRMEDLSIRVHGTAIHDETEWAKFRAATLPHEHEEAVHARHVIHDLTNNVLGLSPDAERGRLVLAPWLPDDWQTAVFENIGVDDAKITLKYEPDRDAVRFSIEQVAGAYPVRLIFEPALPQRIAHVFVDGVLASLNVRSEGGRVRFPIQLMLDARRELLFEVA